MPPPTTTTEEQATRPGAPHIRVPVRLGDTRDMRAKRPPLLSFLLRMETLRRIVRIVSLLALDVGGVVGAIYTAPAPTALVRGDYDPAQVWHGTTEIAAFACLVTLLLFARGGLY